LYNAANAFLHGEGCEVNVELGRQFLLEAAGFGNSDAQYLLATKYQEKAVGFEEKLNVKSNIASTVASTERNSVNSGSASTATAEDVFNLYALAAERGHTAAQVNLAYCFMSGTGTAADSHKAVHWYALAASTGNSASAQCHLGWCYWTGRGVEADKLKAKSLFEQSVTNGYTPAIYNLAMWYKHENQGTLKRPEYEANYVKFLTLAADAGEMRAQATLGWCYRVGDSVSINFNEAVKWFTLAAEQGKVGLITQTVFAYNRIFQEMRGHSSTWHGVISRAKALIVLTRERRCGGCAERRCRIMLSLSII
jgi:TPR repeat protein